MNRRNEKVKELFAYLVYRRGDLCTNDTLITVVRGVDAPNDSASQSALRKVIMELRTILSQAGAEEVLVREYNATYIDTERIECDYYDYLNGLVSPAQVNGELFSEYLWAEELRNELKNSQ